jgi:hypothetical protein
MQKDRRIVVIGIQAEMTDHRNREASYIAMHEIKYADNGGERGKTLDGLKDCDRAQATPHCDRRCSFDQARPH